MQAETIYQTLFWIGALGVGAMGVMGAAAHGSHGGAAHHTGHGAHGHAPHGVQAGHGAAAHTPGHHAPAHHGGHGHANGYGDHGAHSHHGTHGNHADSGANALGVILGIISPMMLFSVSLGTGATGMLLGHRFPVLLTAILAAIAGIALFSLVIRPLMGWVQGWASKPAQALAGAVAGEAIAQNRFDEQGRGIVNVTIDGQIVRLLAYLERGDHANGMIVERGDHLVITKIEETNNTCRVTKI